MKTSAPRPDHLAFASLADIGAALASLGQSARAAPAELALRGAPWCKFHVSDDCITIDPCENITVTHCVLTAGTHRKNGVEIADLAETPIRDVHLGRLDLGATETFSANYTDGLRFTDSRFVAQQDSPVTCPLSQRVAFRVLADNHPVASSILVAPEPPSAEILRAT